MTNGFIHLWRQMLESSIWQTKPDILKVWIWCLLRANHKKTKFPFNGQDIELQKGQFITGLYQAAHEIYPKKKNPSLQTIRTAWTYLKSTNRITIKSTNRFSIISVMKYEQYQGNKHKPTTELTTELTIQQQTTNKPLTTDNNDKNDKKENTPMKSLLVWAEEKRGGAFPSPKKQFTAMAMLKKAGVQVGEIKQRWEEMENDQFWKEKGFDFMNIAKSFDRKR